MMKITTQEEHELVPASHEDPQDPGVLKRVLFNSGDFDQECGLQMLNYAVIEPGREFQLHHHESMEEVFYILSGEGEVTVNEETRPISPGMAVVIPRNAVHLMKNVGTGPLEYLAFGAAQKKGATVNDK
jgi:mannose-6-phosphate isomerase-like protein (cupin superfamily)